MFATMSPGRRIGLAAAAVVVVFALLVLGSAVVLRLSGGGADRRTVGTGPAPAPSTTPVANTTTSGSDGLARDIAMLSAAPVVAPATSSTYPAITGAAAAQPDLFAQAFATRLLAPDYRRPRAELLAWAQAVSAQSVEPRVVELIPSALRGKFAVYSLTEAADGSAVPIPTESEWAELVAKKARTTVQVQHVIEPVKWSEAVAAGELTDPGVTAREVDALVTTQWTERGVVKKSSRSVALSMTLEGPPTVGKFGFVSCVTFTAVTE